MVRIATNGTIEEPNILGSFIKLSDCPLKDIKNFIDRNGFVFPLNEKDYDAINPDRLKCIIEKMKFTVELMSATSAIEKDYDKILTLTLLLIFTNGIEIKTDAMAESYHTFEHPFAILCKNASAIPESSDAQIIRSYDNYLVYDAVYEKDISYDFYEYQNIKSGCSSSPAHTDFYQRMIYLHINYMKSSKEKYMIDFFYHYLKEVGDIMDFTYEKGIQYSITPNYNNFTSDLKNALIKVAHSVLGDEINANLSGIYPAYNPETMAPSWRVESLLSAMYFSIFYIRPDLELYRQCPRCGTYFLVKTTSTRKRYCSTECCNRQTQETYRRKKRMEQINK